MSESNDDDYRINRMITALQMMLFIMKRSLILQWQNLTVQWHEIRNDSHSMPHTFALVDVTATPAITTILLRCCYETIPENCSQYCLMFRG